MNKLIENNKIRLSNPLDCLTNNYKLIQFNTFGHEATFHHLGIAVSSIDKISQLVQIINDPIQKVNIAFVSFNGFTIELLEPHAGGSPIDENLKNRNKLLHLAFVVPDLKKAINSSRLHGFHRISDPVPAVAFKDQNIVWVYSPTYGLVELIEYDSEIHIITF